MKEEPMVSIPLSHYNKLIAFRVRADIQKEFDAKASKLNEKIKEAENNASDWYMYYREADKERNAFRNQIAELKKELGNLKPGTTEAA